MEKQVVPFEVNTIRKEFPILEKEIDGKRLIYLDNAATTQKPTVVINAIEEFYRENNANVHRGVYPLSEKATEKYESARVKAQKFINASESSEVIFTRGVTEGINFLSVSLCRYGLFEEESEIIISEMEHHSNIVPWQLVCGKSKIRIKTIPVTDSGELDLDAYKKLFSEKTKLVSVTHVSNTLGTINDIKEITKIAHEHGVPIIIDGAQAAAHLKIDVQKTDCDFYVISGHKAFAPTGIGILYGKRKWLDKIPPYQGGGEMIDKVTFTKSTFAEPPAKFEAGTQNIAGAIGLGKALEFINNLNRKETERYEKELLEYATHKLKEIKGLKIIGEAKRKSAVISFVVQDVNSYDIGTLLGNYGIAVRTGHLCTQPLMKRFGIQGTVRISLALYNTKEEVDLFIQHLKKVLKILG